MKMLRRSVVFSIAGCSLFLLCSNPLSGQDLVATALRAEITLNGGWQYQLNQPQTIPTSGWSITRVPALPLSDGTASVWYQQTFFVPTSWNQPGRRFFVKLEKAGHYAAVYVNGTFIYDHFGQSSPFEVEVTGTVLFGKANLIQVYVHKADTTYIRRGVDINQSSCPTANPDCIGNAYRSATDTDQERNWVGLVGDVTFSWRPATYASDVFVVTSVRNSTIQANLQVSETGSATITAQATVLDGTTPVLTLPSVQVVNGAAKLQSSWTNPVLWGPVPYGQPKLYTLETDLIQNGTTIDTSYTQFGFREIWWQGNTVYLNGVKLWMVGNTFEKLSPIRYINDRREEAFSFFVAESSGSNTLQSHWDDPGETWLQLADEMGILVVGSFFCDGRPAIQSQVDSATAWTDWMSATTTEWVTARRNHPSIVMWRPLDKLPQKVPDTAYSSIAGVVRRLDTSGRPIADGSDIDVWGQNVISSTDPSQCDTGARYAAKLASEVKPLFIKEINGGTNAPCASTFFNTIYNDAYTGRGLGLVTPQNIFNDQDVTPNWFSIAGIGNRPTTTQVLPNWMSRTWSPTAYSTEFAGLYTTYFQPSLLLTSPVSGDYEASGLKAAAPNTAAFLVPLGRLGYPVGALVAQDGSGTDWLVTPQAGEYQLVYTNGTKDVITNVQVSAPPPF